MTGRTVLHQIPAGTEINIAVQGWPVGLYTVQYGASVGRLVVQR
jgi:hypothetical protein